MPHAQPDHKSQNKRSQAASERGSPTASPRAKLRSELVKGPFLSVLSRGSFIPPILSQFCRTYSNGLVH